MSDSIRLGELVALQRGTTYKSARIGESGPVLLGLGTIQRNGGFRDDQLRSYGGESPANLLLYPGDLFLSLKDVTQSADLLGAVARVPTAVDVGRLTQDTVRLDVHGQEISSNYLYWMLRTPQYRSYCREHATGTTNLGLSREDFLSYKIPRPTPDLMVLVELLGALDDKIAANANLALTADAWVRAVFTEMTRKAEAKVVLAQLLTVVKDPVEPYTLSVDTIYVGLEHIPRRLMWLNNCGAATSVTSTKSRFETGDILFGKLRPYFHKVVSASVGGVCSTDVLVVRPVDKRGAGFVLAAVASDEVIQSCTAGSEGTRMPRTSWRDLAGVEVPWPGDAAAAALSEKVSRLRDAAEAHLRENDTLATTRDTLLPQLMSGRMRVKDAEKMAEEVL